MKGNKANYGGALYLYVNNFNYDVRTTHFESNVASLHGGAVYMYSNNNLAAFEYVNLTKNIAYYNGMFSVSCMRYMSVIFSV